MQAIDHLNKKLDQLLKKYIALEAENKRLKQTVASQNKSLDGLGGKLASLEKDMVSVHLGRTTNSEEEKENMRRQLDTVIAEIDKILNTLND